LIAVNHWMKIAGQVAVKGSKSMIRAGRGLIVFLAIVLSGCGWMTDPSRSGIRGLPPTVEQLNFGTASDAQQHFVAALIQRAGLPPGIPAPGDPRWGLVFRAGVQLVDGQCDQYLDALFRFNREQRAGRIGLAATAATTGAMMGLAGASSTALAITAAAFGLTSSLFEATTDSMLFSIEPSALRNVVLQGRFGYLKEVKDQPIVTQPDAMLMLQGYLTQCSPAAIEANINNAASGAPSVVTNAREAAMLAAPGAVLNSLPNVAPPPISPAPAPSRPRDQVRPGPTTAPPPVSANYRPFIEDANQDPRQLEKIFAALCVLPTEVSDAMAASTTARIKAFQQWFNSDPDPAKPLPTGTGRLITKEIDFLKGQPACDRTRFQNIYEANFLRGVSNKPSKDINSPALITAMNQKLAEPKLTPKASVKDMRGRIQELRQALANQLILKDSALSDQLTKDFVGAIMRSH
jgi:hypothetical protein